jgi:uncharacterized protein
MSLKAEAIGHVLEIYRYPVKSMAGESLSEGRIEAYGLFGDRSHAFIDESKQGWDRFITARDIPGLLDYRARFLGDGSNGEFPRLTVTARDGTQLEWNERLLEEIQTSSSRNITMLRYPPDSAGLLGVDAGSLLIISDKSLKKLEQAWGKQLDRRRFRANVVLALADDSIRESDWIGKQLLIGHVRLKVDEPCERCSMITIDPDTIEKDPSLLKTVVKEMDACFGVYASVLQTGHFVTGDPVYFV